MIKETLQAMNDQELVQVAHELTKTSYDKDSIMHKLVREQENFAFHIIEVNAHLTQVLAERLYACSPHIER